MKKLFFACVLCFSSLAAFAQDSPGVLSFSAKEMYGTNEPIVATAQYTEVEPGTSQLVSYQWELRPVDPDGNVGDPIFSQNYDGDPTGDFTFPEDLRASLKPENKYQINLTAIDNRNILLSAYPFIFDWSNYVLTAPKEICCGEGITVTGSFTGDAILTLGMTYEWTVTMCDAAGNSTWPLAYYDSGALQGYPFGAFTVPNSWLPFPTGVACDQYYRIDLVFSPGQADVAKMHRSVIVHMTSFMLSANTNYCTGQFIYASGKYCQGVNSPAVNDHQWSLYQSDAAGNILSNNLLPALLIGGAPTPNEIVYYTNNLAPGYYLLKLDFMYYSTVQGTRTQVVYVNPSIQATVSGPAATCGMDTYTATPAGTGNVYQWSATNGSTPSPISISGNNATIGTGNFNNVGVTVTNQNGCTSHTQMAVTSYYVDPTITVHSYPLPGNSGYFYVKINRTGNYSPSIVHDWFTIERANTPGINPPTTTGPSSNACWSSPSWTSDVYLFGYDGYQVYSSGYNNCTTPNWPNGRFQNGVIYRLCHYTETPWSTCFRQFICEVNENGLLCTGCRTADEINSGTSSETSNLFDVFPNPSNGSFTVQFSDATENAQAELFNTMGERVDAFTCSGTSYDYSPSQKLAPGLYMLRITNNGATSTRRIVVE